MSNTDLSRVAEIEMDDCDSCGEMMPANECPKAERACGHHCNHSWSHDACCWCGATFGESVCERYEVIDGRDEFRCVLPNGHTQRHRDATGIEWTEPPAASGETPT